MTTRLLSETPEVPLPVALSLLLAAMLSVGGCGRPRPSHAAERAEAPRFKVATATIVDLPVPSTISLTGTLVADVRADVTANAAGRVARTFVERGQRVAKGTVLAQLDVRSATANAAEARAQEESAKTQLEAAENECSRRNALAARGAITAREYEEQATTCKERLSALAGARARLVASTLVVENGTVRAPYTGIVTERFVSVGDYVQASSKVATVVVSHPLRLALTVPERRLAEVKEGALVTFTSASVPGRTFSGTIKYLGGEVRIATRDLLVEAVVPNADGALLPGMFVEAHLRIGERPMPVVPKSAVLAAGPDAGLFVVKDKQLVLRTVLIGAQVDGFVAIEEGAQPSELVVTNPTSAMFDGAAVE